MAEDESSASRGPERSAENDPTDRHRLHGHSNAEKTGKSGELIHARTVMDVPSQPKPAGPVMEAMCGPADRRFGQQNGDRSFWVCWEILLLAVLPLIILGAGIILRGTLPSWFRIPIGILILPLTVLILLLVLVLIFRRASSSYRYVVLSLAVLIVIIGVIAVAALTQPWSELTAWFTLVFLLAVPSAFAGSVIGWEIVRYCRAIRRETVSKLVIGRTFQDGPLKVKSFEPEDKTEYPALLRRPSAQLVAPPDQPQRGVAYQTVSRFTGPFFLREFEEIQVVLNKNQGEWYYNDYFSKVDPAIYRKYYWPANLGDPTRSADAHKFPATPSPENPTSPGLPPPRPGGATGPPPSDNGAHGVLMTLKSIHYSSRYGGSVKLVFDMEEEHFYEFRFAPYLYDLPGLKMNVHVVPVAILLNPSPIPPAGNLTLRGPYTVDVFVEFELPEHFNSYVEAYEDGQGDPVDLGKECPSGGTTVGIGPVPPEKLADARNHLFEKLVAYGGLLADSMKLKANCFTYGFLHDLHKDTISTEAIRPDRISISDNHFELVTHQGEPVFSIRFRITDFEAMDSGTIWAKPEIEGAAFAIIENETIDSRYVEARQPYSIRDTIEVEEGEEYTYWSTAASYSFWDLQRLVQGLIQSDARFSADHSIDCRIHAVFKITVDLKWHGLLTETYSGSYTTFYPKSTDPYAEEFGVLMIGRPRSVEEGPYIEGLVQTGKAGVANETTHEVWDEQTFGRNFRFNLKFQVTLHFR